MKKKFNNIISIFAVSIFIFTGSKQLSAQQPRPVPANYAQNTPINFVRTWDAMAPIQDPNTLMSMPLRDVKQTTQYIDGLGRPLQTVVKEGSLATGYSPTDLISPVVYDSFGREMFKYLPFAANTTGGYPTNDGKFRLNPFQQQAAFMNDQYSTQNETFFYSKTNFEASPLNRVTDTYAPGNSWVGSETFPAAQRRNVQTKYWINTATDAVKIWNVTNAAMGSWGSYAVNTANNGGIYPAGELYKNVTVDEHKKQVIEFKDKDGKVILKKVQLSTTAGTEDDGTGRGHSGWLCTYYIYDDLNNLRCVVQPQAVTLMNNASNWNLATYLDEQCFRYEYDNRNRMIMKKVPGAGEVYMVYDSRDRLVMTQDANMRLQKKWLYTKYDDLNRPVSTGLITDNSNYNNPGFHSSAAGNSTDYPNLSNYPGFEELTRTFYDNYDWLPAHANPFPSSDYINSFDANFLNASNQNWPYPQLNVKSTQIKGMLTGTKIKVLNSSTYLYSMSIYDDKGRPIQVQNTNITGGIDIISTQYSWAGLPLVTVQKQDKQGINAQVSVVVTQITNDDLGRLVKVEKRLSNTQVNGNAMPAYKTIVQNEYDKLGQLKKKVLGSNGIETLSYDYNIHGWMLGMNRAYLTQNGQVGNTKFGFELGYDKLTGSSGRNFQSAQYNGNINGMVWKSDGDDVRRKYDFSYDAANRFLKGLFEQDNTTASWNTTTMNYNVLMGDGSNADTAYDANGNIKAMTQYGWKPGGSISTPIDNLTYNYYTNSNRLLNVIDLNNIADTRLGDFRSSALHPVQNKTNTTVDYTYDVNGNLKKDLNKDIGLSSTDGIIYNYLNLPQTITVYKAGQLVKGTITYTYDAAGNKLKKEVAENGQPVKTTLYIAGAVYENDVLQFIAHEEGRIRFKPAADNIPASLQYDYMLKDHLGNVRMVLTEEQQVDMYPSATMEDSNITNESTFYGNLTNTQVSKPGTWFSDPSYPANEKVAKVKNTSTDQKIGPNIILKVMAGDSYHIRVASGWKSSTAASNNSTNVLSNLLTLLSTAVASANGGKATQGELQNTSSGLNAGLSSFMATQTTTGTKPKAYLNWILLDEQFKIDSSNSGFEQVGASGITSIHVKQNLTVSKSGYLYIYTSNEATNIDVFFDNLQVTHNRGPILEETHYYPFGLTMSGISSKAAGTIQNKETTFQGQRFDDDLGLNWVQFKWRNHDPQSGRFLQIDPLADSYRYNSTYSFSENRITDGRELEGLEYVSIHHYSDGEIFSRIHYKSTDKEINDISGTTAGIYNSASYGPEGKGAVHYYYNSSGEIYETRWEQRQKGANSNFKFHGLYSGPGGITNDGRGASYDFSFQPIDWSDAIAKRHDMDYVTATAKGEKYAGYLEDVRTVQADRDMVQRIKDYVNPFKKVEGVETPYRTSWSGEMHLSMRGQMTIIDALATYKQWKIDNGYGNKDSFETLKKVFYLSDPLNAAIIDLINPTKQ